MSLPLACMWIEMRPTLVAKIELSLLRTMSMGDVKGCVRVEPAPV